MHKTLVGLLISFTFFVPAFASASSYSHSNHGSKDRTPPSVTSVHIASSNTDPSVAVAGDTVTITITVSEKIKTPVVLAETKTLFVRAHNTSGNSWEASYVVKAKDRTGKVDYILAMIDVAKNHYVCSSARIPFIKYCPTTDGSSVTVYKETTPPPPPTDTEAPVIAVHEDVHATTTETALAVEYALPEATDNVDASVEVSCAPASGSEFAVGTTTVTCTAEDAAGNEAISTFEVVVAQEIIVVPPPEPAPYTMASQPDELYLCGVENASWRFCDAGATFGFTDDFFVPTATIDLGVGSSMGTGTLQTVTIAKDPSGAYGQINLFHPWLITISCYTDASHTSTCSDWSAISDDANDSSDGKHWSADFSSHDRTFNQAAYYTLTIDDTGWETPAFGSESLQEPYWVITGLR